MANGYVLKLADAQYTKWACEWRPSWKPSAPQWASTASIGEAAVFDTPEDALAWARHFGDLGHVEVWHFVLEPT